MASAERGTILCFSLCWAEAVLTGHFFHQKGKGFHDSAGMRLHLLVTLSPILYRLK